MSGHSKWAQIKRQKGVADARRGQVFTKIARELAVAARQGGGDPDANFRLRLVIQKAREANMPAENIERAIKRGSGGGEAASLIEITYEGYGPGGTAIMVEALTDNRNRTVADIRNIFARAGGALGESGCVSWLFDSKGLITVEADSADPEEVALEAIDAGAEDVKVEHTTLEVHTEPQTLEAVRESLEKKGLKVSSVEMAMVPKSTVTLDDKAAVQTLKLLDKLEEMDEVQHVYSNADFPDEVLDKYEG